MSIWKHHRSHSLSLGNMRGSIMEKIDVILMLRRGQLKYFH